MSKQPKFQVKYGSWSTDFIIVDADELEKLHYAKKLGAFFTGKYGDVDTTKITAVKEDYKETYGAMPEYELEGEDIDEIKRAFGDIRTLPKLAEDRVRYLIEMKQEHLIGTGVKIPELDRPTTEKREGKMSSMSEIIAQSK